MKKKYGQHEISLDSIIKFKGHLYIQGLVQCHSSSINDIKKGMQIAADYLKKFAWEIINGDSHTFNKVYEYVESKAKIAEVESKLVTADLLWQNGQRGEAAITHKKYHKESNKSRLKKIRILEIKTKK
jgi:hypothetical protein